MPTDKLHRRIFILSSLFFLACSPFLFGCKKKTPPEEARTPIPLPAPATSRPKYHEILDTLPRGEAQLETFCAQKPNGQDRFRLLFCDGDSPKATQPRFTSLNELKTALGFGDGTGAKFAATTHSSSLVARDINAINPRVVIFDNPIDPLPANHAAMTFSRGKQFVEVVAKDPADTDPNTNLSFYVLAFEQACNESGCSVGQLLTPEIESNWAGQDVYSDKDFENTVFDCLHCHQPDGPGTPRILRMQELTIPWMHWMVQGEPPGDAVIADYTAAHGNEVYATIADMTASDPEKLQAYVTLAGFGTQPNQYNSSIIFAQGRSSAPGQPTDNTPPGQSAEWDTLFAAFKAGDFIAPPYHDAKVTNPSKLAEMTQAYQDFRSAKIAAKDLPDIRDAFLESKRWAMFGGPQPGSTPQEIMIQACAQCHNGKLNQNISRARFNGLDVNANSSAELQLAIERLTLPEDDLQAMPPYMFRYISSDERKALIDLFKATIEAKK